VTRIAVIDDEPGIVWALTEYFRDQGYAVVSAPAAEEALRAIAADPPDVAFIDIRLPGMDGLTAAEQIRRDHPNVRIVIMTAHGTMDHAVRAMKLGAVEYLPKPLDLARARQAVERALRPAVPAAEVEAARREPGLGALGIVGQSPAMQEVYAQVAKVAATDACVLLFGESGSGKELIARAIHHHSARSEEPFEPINCAAIPETLLESEMFGHEKGAFTGAHASRPGKFEQADGGTVFLDEVALLSPSAQAKLLRFLDQKKFERVGGTGQREADVRILAATNLELDPLVAAGRFREDLFFRLNVVAIRLPPLRRRMEDLPLLVAYYVTQFGAAGISAEAMARLRAYEWPGNVRQLRNVIERGGVLAGGGMIGAEHVQLGEGPPSEAGDRIEAMARAFCEKEERDLYDRWAARWEPALIRAALEACGGNLTKAAERLGLSRVTLRAKIKQYGLR
jgi:DNA-binding NtrC family response regulator